MASKKSKNFSINYGTRKFITVFIKVSTCSCCEPDESSPRPTVLFL